MRAAKINPLIMLAFPWRTWSPKTSENSGAVFSYKWEVCCREQEKPGNKKGGIHEGKVMWRFYHFLRVKFCGFSTKNLALDTKTQTHPEAAFVLCQHQSVSGKVERLTSLVLIDFFVPPWNPSEKEMMVCISLPLHSFTEERTAALKTGSLSTSSHCPQ